MNRYEDENITLSTEKLKKWLKKGWIVILVCFIIGILLDGILIFRDNHKKITPTVKNETTGNMYFQSAAYIGIDWGNDLTNDDQLSMSTDPFKKAEYDYNQITIHKNILEQCKYIYLFDNTIEQINNELKSKSFATLSEADKITLNYNSSETVNIVITSQGSVDRHNEIMNIALSLFENLGQEKYKLGNIKEVDKSDVYMATKMSNGITRSDQTAEEWMGSNVNKEQGKIGKQHIIILLVMIVFALLIIFILALLDKDFDSQKEVENKTGLGCLGVFNKDDSNMISEVLSIKYKNLEPNQLALIVNKDLNTENISYIKNKIFTNGITGDVFQAINKDTITKIGSMKNTIFIVKKDMDKANIIKEQISIMKSININILGFVWIE